MNKELQDDVNFLNYALTFVLYIHYIIYKNKTSKIYTS